MTAPGHDPAVTEWGVVMGPTGSCCFNVGTSKCECPPSRRTRRLSNDARERFLSRFQAGIGTKADPAPTMPGRWEGDDT